MGEHEHGRLRFAGFSQEDRNTRYRRCERAPAEMLCICQLFFCMFVNIFSMHTFCCCAVIGEHVDAHPARAFQQGGNLRNRLSAGSSQQQPCRHQCIFKIKINTVSVVQKMFFLLNPQGILSNERSVLPCDTRK